MARPTKRTVDYFPFYVKDGKTLFILEGRYGCAGSGFFTNVLRFLCSTPDHHFCIADDADRMFFFSRTHCDEQDGLAMLEIMAKTGKIYGPLWVSGRVIVSPDLLASITDAYDKRSNAIITMKEILSLYPQKTVTGPGNAQASEFPAPEIGCDGVSGPGNTQIKLNKTKQNKRNIYPVSFEEFWKAYPKHTAKKGAFAEWKKAEATGLLPTLDAILSAIKDQKRAKQRASDTGQFASEWPDPERWIKKARWEDEVESGSTASVQRSQQSGGSAAYVKCPKCGKEVLDSCIDPDGLGCYACIRGGIPGAVKDRIEAGA